ncbi:MAG TPA: hypothetical protein VMS98_01710 [Thermoanaerobaculia bacterium]|nr:hypothetical protein [Thermoanaerobaculia bacterium]
MKRVITLAAAVLLSFPLIAAEEEKGKTTEPQAKPAVDSQAKPAVDSPMVAAAKRTNRGAKKSIVITNEDVKNSKGRLTTTSVVRQVFVPEPRPTPEMVAAEKAAKARAIEAEQAAKVAAARKAEQDRMERAAYNAEEGGEDAYVGGDPGSADKKP